RKPRREVRRLDLEESLRVGQPLEPVIAQGAEADADRNRGLDGSRGGVREKDLAAMASGADAGGSVHGQSHVAAVGQRGAAGVDADADSYAGPVRPCP